ncbi:phytoene/squalene synthase family protein [Paenibacillus urinalis]|uniref:Phytoene/squalene synthase family protein n=1 Tax=Paenibacillus urinalis TaxID=521520 RepID=A0AAX3MXG5_9BACL|nr:phytoene/squalene synthase family protein [Paenibacillus urinalis]WDH82311.1 phytoene/squalene synthase family protein [Paenibacillus urinalis]
MNEAIISRCEEMIRKGSASFYHAFRGLPSPRREAVFVIYAFCRLIDDSVDEPDQAPYSIFQLQHHLKELDQAEGHFIWPALRWLFGEFPNLTKEPFFRQMEGQISDLTLTHYSTMKELEHYCYLVAGTVGEMLLPVLRDDNSVSAMTSCIALGKAMQIVNIVRDVGEDKARNRRYIPMELMVRHGYTMEDFEEGIVDERFISVIRELQEIASRWFEEGLADVNTYPPLSGFAVELAASFYASILDAVEANQYDVYTKRAFVTDERKMKLFLKLAAKHKKRSGKRNKAAVS